MTQEQHESIEAVLSNRLYLYSLFHQVFGYEPTAKLLEILAGDATLQAIQLLSEQEGDSMDQTARYLPTIGERLAQDPAWLETVRTEYNHCFVGPNKLIAPPWESIYLGKQEVLFTDTTLEVRNFYKSQGYQAKGYPHVADDSLALELDFMAKLSEKVLEQFRAENEAAILPALRMQEIFLRLHPLVWMPKFLERMNHASTDELYPELSTAVTAFFRQDEKLLLELIALLENEA